MKWPMERGMEKKIHLCKAVKRWPHASKIMNEDAQILCSITQCLHAFMLHPELFDVHFYKLWIKCWSRWRLTRQVFRCLTHFRYSCIVVLILLQRFGYRSMKVFKPFVCHTHQWVEQVCRFIEFSEFPSRVHALYFESETALQDRGWTVTSSRYITDFGKPSISTWIPKLGALVYYTDIRLPISLQPFTANSKSISRHRAKSNSHCYHGLRPAE